MKDIYYCLSSQAKTGPAINGIPTAVRNAQNADDVKALWLDVDVKPEKGYATVDDAIAALGDFRARANLPPFSAIVLSGGGIHAYWISDVPLPVDEWRPYAEGLKALAKTHGLRCDAQITADPARILRVPGTYNYKTEPPRPVRLAALAPHDLDFGTALAHIKQAAPPRPTARPMLDPKLFPPRPIPPEGLQSLAEGIYSDEHTPLDWTAVIQECPHFREAAITHGAGYEQGLWMLDVLACTFVEDGQKLAHYLSKGYKTYDPGETDKMYDRKEADRKIIGLGWPSCKAFEDAGCKSCAACVHRGKIKSPLNLAQAAVPALGSDTQIKLGKIDPIATLMQLHKSGADIGKLFAVMNDTFAVVRYGQEILIASIIGKDLIFMKVEDFHKMFANIRIKEGDRSVEVSRLWFKWPGRRQYVGRGVVFEPGGPPEIQNDMLNLWRGFGFDPKQGDWSLMLKHLFDVVCSGQQQHFDYLIRWMAYAVQHLDEPMGVAVALLGAQGTGKGIVARTFGSFFGKHFAHIANGDQLTGRFNWSIGSSCVVFLDEALWAGDKKGEGVLKALITEPRLNLEAKFRDPIKVENRLRIIVASNNEWAVPAGIGDRRWFVLYVANTHAGTAHSGYWTALYKEIDNGGAAAMLYDLLDMDLSGFDVRAVPHTAAKAHQQVLGLSGTEAWIHQVLQTGQIWDAQWQNTGLLVSTGNAYHCYEEFSKRQHAFRPDLKSVWSKKIREVFGPCVADLRQTQGNNRVRLFRFAPLADCRHQFASHVGTPTMEWEAEEIVQPTRPEAFKASSPEDVEWDPVSEDDIEWQVLPNPFQIG
jgi:hypothetical protein